MDTIAARMPLTPLRARSRWRMPTPAEVLKHGKGNLQERDIIISEAKVDLTKGDQNPMDNVPFFDYPESTEKKTVPRHHISAMFPECNRVSCPLLLCLHHSCGKCTPLSHLCMLASSCWHRSAAAAARGLVQSLSLKQRPRRPAAICDAPVHGLQAVRRPAPCTGASPAPCTGARLSG